MSIPTSRTEETATVTIDQLKCTGCGKCITVCSDFGFKIINGKATRSEEPLFDVYIGSMNKGIDHVTYDAPVALYFYGTPYCDPADPIIAATYAMTAAESLGLGSCMLGAIHPFLQFGFGVKEFRNKYNIRFKSREGLVLIVGYPKVKYARGIRRTFANVDFY